MAIQNKWHLNSRANPKSTNELVEILLKNRNITTKKQQQEFLSPKNPSEYSLKELDINPKQVAKAISRVKKAKKGGEKVLVFGDYDADGITATAILWECLYAHGIKAMPFIPDRFSDGYGINSKSLKRIISEQSDISLIITVDNGIVAHEAIKFASKKKIDVIVTDHHKKAKTIPKAHAVVHTTITSGSTIAWVLASKINEKLAGDKQFSIKSLELAAIGTVADQLPLIGFNRAIVKHGLKALSRSSRSGLKNLFKITNIDPVSIGTYHINYSIAPRINASGRLESGLDGLRLLCTTDVLRSARLANKLDSLNKERQDLVIKLFDIAKDQVDQEKKIIVVSHEDFHEGVIGLIASKLVESFYRPAIVLSVGGETAKASARSVRGFSIIDAINKYRELILEGGGHDMAAGFSINTEKVKEFESQINKGFENVLTEDILSPRLEIDSYLDFSLLNWEMYSELEKFEPFGIGNRRPSFLVQSCEIVEAKKVGADSSHLKLKIGKDGYEFDAIAFRRGYLFEELEKHEKWDFVCQVDKNEWNGKKSLQLIVRDVRGSGTEPV